MQIKRQALPARVRLRTLVYIRWVAIAGQFATLILVHFGLGYKLPIIACLAIVALSVVVNIVTSLRRPLRQTLSDRAAALFLGYDMLQLSALLFMTGGLHNPFSVLILASVTVSATVLSRGSTIGLGMLAGVAVTVLAFWHEPFPWLNAAFNLPDYYILGIWQALIVGVLFISAFIGSVSEQARDMASGLAETQLALEREQRVSALGALAAAAAHELGSPLSTIAVVAREMSRDVPRDSPLAPDIDLLLEQTNRCSEILADLSREQVERDGTPFSRLALGLMLQEAARPHLTDLIDVDYDLSGADGIAEPEIDRTPEFIHGVGTLIQNAIQFAERRVSIRGRWDETTARVEILDDGPGISPHLLDRLGEPYVSTRTGDAHDREHMGLGVFIAQTLLNRIGADLTISNRPKTDPLGGGATVRIEWPRQLLERPHEKEVKADNDIPA
ncbi:MAG: ActS/PrrB/RegB family redox-sensitive histidine kinase [Bauldia litoralis]